MRVVAFLVVNTFHTFLIPSQSRTCAKAQRLHGCCWPHRQWTTSFSVSGFDTEAASNLWLSWLNGVGPLRSPFANFSASRISAWINVSHKTARRDFRHSTVSQG